MDDLGGIRLPIDELYLPPMPNRQASLAVIDLVRTMLEPDKLIRPADHAPRDTLSWGCVYLSAHFTRPPSAMHQWLSREFANFKDRGRKLNLIGPRGSAKSTIGTLCYVLLAAVESWEPYIWIISDTKHQAQTHLENVKAELAENAALAKGYPHSTGQGPRWRATSIELRNGVVIESFGTGQRIRGRRRRSHRPTLIVCDDLQNDSHMSSAAQREATRRWFHGTLLKAGTKTTNVVNLATALHRDALAVELLTAPGWTSARFAAIQSWPTDLELWQRWEEIFTQSPTVRDLRQDKETRRGGDKENRSEARTGVDDKRSSSPCLPVSLSSSPTDAARAFYTSHKEQMDAGAEVLWPEVEDLYTLMRMRVESGHAAFEREKQGSPVDPESCEWPADYFGEYIWFESWEGLGTRDWGLPGTALPAPSPQTQDPLVIKTIALDPSKGHDARRGDYSALVMLGIDAAGVIYVEADLARRATPQMVADGVVWCGRFRPLVFGIEANQYQELLAGEIEAEFARQQVVGINLAGIHNTINKQLRIRRLGPLLSQRRLRFLAGSASTKLLVEQLRDFPAGAHDDGPDALEMALRLAEDIWLGRNANDGLGTNLIRN